MDTIKKLAVKKSVKKKIAGPLAQPDATSVAKPTMNDTIVSVPPLNPTERIRKFYKKMEIRRKISR